MSVRIINGDCRLELAALPDCSVDCCISSPPYFGLRDYGSAAQIGLEDSPAAFIAQMVDVFGQVRRVLKADGTLWLNLGDSYAGSGRGGNPPDSPHQKQKTNRGSAEFIQRAAVEAGAIGRNWVKPPHGYKQKDLIGIPWEVAFALRESGWWLRDAIIWAKPAMMLNVRFVSPAGYDEAHFAVMPEEIARRCILAGCPEGGTVLDPFGGAGTTGLMASRLGRNAILIELNPEYAAMAEQRIANDAPLLSYEAAS